MAELARHHPPGGQAVERRIMRIEPRPGAIRALVGDIVRLQGGGDYAGTKAFLDKWGVLDPEANQVIASMTHIPVDIRPTYPEKL